MRSTLQTKKEQRRIMIKNILTMLFLLTVFCLYAYALKKNNGEFKKEEKVVKVK